MNELGFGIWERDLRTLREQEAVMMRFWFPREYIQHSENVKMYREREREREIR
jgi:hypothetical protein